MNRLLFASGVLCVLIMIGCSRSRNIDPLYNFTTFCAQYGKTYHGQEAKHHEEIFKKNYEQYLNRTERGEDPAVNQRMDWNQTQLSAFNNYHPQKIPLALSSPPLSASGLFLSPSSYDWKALGRVTPVKNQGSCGSCWAFGSTAQYESLLSIATNGIQYDLSEQYSVECDNISSGCNGGYPYYTNLLINQTGIPLQSSYPYNQYNDRYYRNNGQNICSANNKIKLSKKVTGVNFYSSLTNEQIQQYLVDNGPLGIGLYASDYSFNYAGSSGMISCSSSSPINHAIILYGYNSSHWFVKNSWGTSWGDNGYGYISKTANCGLTTYVNVIFVDYTQDQQGINIIVVMGDTGSDGWNGNVIGFKQNGLIVAKFGQKFTEGFLNGPQYFSINKNTRTEIIVANIGNKSNEVGFIVKIQNMTIYTKSPGSIFNGSTIFTTFCPTSNCPPPTIKLTIVMTDSNNTGWNGNVLGFIQNGTVVGDFGAQFTNGSNYGPKYITILGDIQTSLVVLQLGTLTQQIGFIVYLPDGTVLHNRTSGSTFSSSTNFKDFCPIGVCPAAPTVSVNVTMTDSGSNGWNGNIVGFRQNGIIVGQFGSTFINGSSLGPISFTLNGKINTEVVATTIGNFTNEIGFELKFSNGTIIHTRSSGTTFGGLTIFATFCGLGGCPPSVVTVSVTMTDSSGDGWNGNVLGFKQNGAFVSKFGDGFTYGSSHGPLFFNILGNVETELGVFQFLSNNYNDTSIPMGFTVRTRNGTIIYSQGPGFAFNQNTVFSTFCLLGNCLSPRTSIIVTMTDSGNNGWNGYVFGFRQSGQIVGQFGQNFTSGGSYGPVNIKINGSLNTDIVVVQTGSNPTQIGFVVKLINNTVVHTLAAGSTFNNTTVFRTFCPTINCEDYVVLKVTLQGCIYGNGYHGMVLGFRQNGTVVACFGQNFTTGSNFGPLFFTLPNKNTQIIVCQMGSSSSQVGFIIYNNMNDSIIYSRSTGIPFSSSIVFTSFCPLGGCPPPPANKYYVTMTGSCDGWNGNVLGVRQNGVIKYNLTFVSGNQSTPLQLSLNRYSQVQIVVLTLGTKTMEVGFIIRSENGYLVALRDAGESFYSNQILASFIPGSVNYYPVPQSALRENKHDEINKKENVDLEIPVSQNKQIGYFEQKYKNSLAGNISLAIILVILIALLIGIVVKLRKEGMSERVQIGTHHMQSAKAEWA